MLFTHCYSRFHTCRFQNYSNQQYVVPSVIDLENVIQVCDVDRGVSVEGHCEMEPQDMCLSFIPKNPWRLGLVPSVVLLTET